MSPLPPLISVLISSSLKGVKMCEQANDPTYIGFSCIADQYQRKVRIANKLLI